MKTKDPHTSKKQETVKQPPAAITDNRLHHLAFANSLQANIVSTVSSGKIILANPAACKLLGYSKKEILTKTTSDIFDIKGSSFKKMLKQRTVDGHSFAQVTVIKKSGKKVLCEITSASFGDESGDEKSITTIVDLSHSILQQKNIDTKKEKVVADNIIQAKRKQKVIDIKKEKQVADDIVLAKSKQKGIDTKNEKIVAANIILAQAISDARLAENNEWIKYIAKTSYDVMWDWDVASGEIYAGDSTEEVFGYKVQNNRVTFTDFVGCLLTEEKEVVEKKLWTTLTSDNKSWNDTFMFRRHDGSIASVSSRASIVRDEKGKAIRLIGAMQDVSRVQELEANLEKQTFMIGEHIERFSIVSTLSFDVMWDWNLLTGEVFRGEGFEELLGHPVKDYRSTLTDWSNHMHPDDKEYVAKGIEEALASSAMHWSDSYRFIKADGSIAKVIDRASIKRDANGKAIRLIGVMHDLSRQKEMEEKLEEERKAKEKLFLDYEAEFQLLFHSSTEILFDTDLVTNKIRISKAFEKEFGWQITDNMTISDLWLSHIHPDDLEALLQNYTKAIESEDIEWRYDYRLLRADQTVVNLNNLAIIMRDSSGKAYRIIGSIRNKSIQHKLKDELQQEIKLKEMQVREAIEDAKQLERTNIGRELHDNINQLLSTSKLYLDMAQRGGTESDMYLIKSSECTILAIEEIRNLSKGLTTDIIKTLGLYEAIDVLCNAAMEVAPLNIYCNNNGFDEHLVNDIFKLNVYRIVQEQLTNILKHAKATKVNIDILQNKKSILLTIADDGVGFSADKKRVGIGLANIQYRVKSFRGTADFVSKPGEGFLLQVTFPFSDALLSMN